MYTNILVPVVFDHGEQPTVSLKIAQELLSDGGRITLLHVMEEIPSYASTYLPDGLAEQLKADALQRLRDIPAGIITTVNAAVIHGHAYSGILEYSKAKDIDCIVIASHKPGFGDYFLGSTAARVVRHAKCAVHVLR